MSQGIPSIEKRDCYHFAVKFRPSSIKSLQATGQLNWTQTHSLTLQPDNGFLSIHLNNMSQHYMRVTDVHFRIKLCNVDVMDSIAVSKQSSRTASWLKIISFDDLENESEGWIQPDGQALLKLTLSVHIPQELVKESDFLKSIVSNLCKAEDLVIFSSDGKEFHLNRNVFMARSEELAAHLRHHEEGKIIFDNIESDVMQHFVKFLKCGSILPGWEAFSIKLVTLADMYNLPQLFKLVERDLGVKVRGHYSTVMRIAIMFRSKYLFEVISHIESVTEDLFIKESDSVKIQVGRKNYRINLALLEYKLAKFRNNDKNIRSRELPKILKGFDETTVSGFIEFLKTAELPDLAKDPFGYSKLFNTLGSSELDKHVENILVSNFQKYDYSMIMDFASTKGSHALFAKASECMDSTN